MDVVICHDTSEGFRDASKLNFHGYEKGGKALALPQHVKSGLWGAGNALAFHSLKELWQIPDLLVGCYHTVCQES